MPRRVTRSRKPPPSACCRSCCPNAATCSASCVRPIRSSPRSMRPCRPRTCSACSASCKALSPAPRNVAEVRQALLLQGREQGGEPIALSREDSDTFELLGLLYTEIGRELREGTPSSDLLERLQVPLLRVALQDREFFVRQHHPARQLLNAVAESGARWLGRGRRRPAAGRPVAAGGRPRGRELRRRFQGVRGGQPRLAAAAAGDGAQGRGHRASPCRRGARQGKAGDGQATRRRGARPDDPRHAACRSSCTRC